MGRVPGSLIQILAVLLLIPKPRFRKPLKKDCGFFFLGRVPGSLIQILAVLFYNSVLQPCFTTVPSLILKPKFQKPFSVDWGFIFTTRKPIYSDSSAVIYWSLFAIFYDLTLPERRSKSSLNFRKLQIDVRN